MIERLLNGERVHFAAQPFTGFNRRFQIMAGYFYGQRIGNRIAGAFFVFHPRRERQSYPNGFSIGQELDIDRIGVPRGHGNNERLVDAVNRFLGPAIGDGEIFKHRYENYNGRFVLGQIPLHRSIGAYR